MQTFELRLQSPVDAQHRLMRVVADSESAARDIAHQGELDIANFSLLPPERDVWEQPPGGEHDETFGLVDLSRWDAYDPAFAKHASALPYADAVSAANARLADFKARATIKDGKVLDRRLGKHSRARLLAHLQADPYEVAEVREVSRVEQEIALAGAEGMAELHRLAKRLRAENDPRHDPNAWAKIFDALRELGVPLSAVTAAIHGVGILTQDDGSAPTVWASNTISIPLLTGYTANVDTHDYWNDVSATEVTGTAYVANGATLGTKTSTYDTGTDQTRLDGADVSWATSTISATDAAVVNRTPGSDATRPVLGSVDFGATVSTTAGTFQITWDATGILVRDYT